MSRVAPGSPTAQEPPSYAARCVGTAASGSGNPLTNNTYKDFPASLGHPLDVADWYRKERGLLAAGVKSLSDTGQLKDRLPPAPGLVAGPGRFVACLTPFSQREQKKGVKAGARRRTLQP